MSLMLALSLAAQSFTNSEIENEAYAGASMVTYGVCLSLSAAQFSSSSESAQTVVDAAFGKCLENRIQLLGFVQKSRRSFDDKAAERIVKSIDAKERKRLLGIVLDKRTKR